MSASQSISPDSVFFVVHQSIVFVSPRFFLCSQNQGSYEMGHGYDWTQSSSHTLVDKLRISGAPLYYIAPSINIIRDLDDTSSKSTPSTTEFHKAPSKVERPLASSHNHDSKWSWSRGSIYWYCNTCTCVGYDVTSILCSHSHIWLVNCIHSNEQITFIVIFNNCFEQLLNNTRCALRPNLPSILSGYILESGNIWLMYPPFPGLRKEWWYVLPMILYFNLK